MNTLQAQTAYVGSTEIKQVRLGNELVLAPNGDILWYKANELPSLDLRFADSKSLVDATTGTTLVDHTRASSGTYVGSDGLIKTATTNLALQSEALNEATNWILGGATVNSNTTQSPVGQLTADKLIEDTSTSTHAARQQIAASGNTTYAASFYAKAAERTYLGAWIRGSSTANRIDVQFNLSNGTVSRAANDVGNFTLVSASILPASNGWYRCVVILTTAAGETSVGIQPFLNTTDAIFSANETYTGDGTSGIYIWGAQLEQSSTVGEYVKTTSTINSAPRFDHDPTTGESLGLLVEESRTNEITDNTNLSSLFAGSATRTSVTILTPDGDANGHAMLTDASGFGTNYENITTSGSDNEVDGTVSFYAKKKTAGTATLTVTMEGGGVSRGFNSGAIDSDTWTKVTATKDYAGSTNFTRRFDIYLQSGNSSDGDTEFYICFLQFENGSFPTSYIPTEGTTVTRAADVASISGSNFSSWMTSFGENTFFVEARNPRTDNGMFVEGGANTVQGISIGANNNASRVRVLVRHGPSRIDTGNVNGALFGDDNIKIAATTSADGSFVYVGGALQAQDGTPNQSDWSQLQLNIGSRYNGSLQPCCTISRITYWSQKLSEPTLQGITQQ